MKIGRFLNNGGFPPTGRQSLGKAMHLLHAPDRPGNVGVQGQPIAARSSKVYATGRIAHLTILPALCTP